MDTMLLILGCSLFVILGLGHAALTLSTTKLEPQDQELLESLKHGRTNMSKTGNIWNGIRGFHLSHSLGLIIYGLFYITLALENSDYLKSSLVFNIGLLGVSIIYILLSHRFWFSLPRNCFVVAFCMILISIDLR